MVNTCRCRTLASALKKMHLKSIFYLGIHNRKLCSTMNKKKNQSGGMIKQTNKVMSLKQKYSISFFLLFLNQSKLVRNKGLFEMSETPTANYVNTLRLLKNTHTHRKKSEKND